MASTRLRERQRDFSKDGVTLRKAGCCWPSGYPGFNRSLLEDVGCSGEKQAGIGSRVKALGLGADHQKPRFGENFHDGALSTSDGEVMVSATAVALMPGSVLQSRTALHGSPVAQR